MIQPVQIFPTSMNTYSTFCRERASYFIGRPDWAMAQRTNISEREALEIVKNLPEELLEVVKEHYKLVPMEVVAESIVETFEKPVLIHDNGEIELTEEEETIDLDKMNITQLRKLASELEIKSYTKYDKEELKAKIEELVESEGE
jgi:hypothetical protein